MQRLIQPIFVTIVLTTASALPVAEKADADRGLIGYWEFQGDCRDHSANGHDGVNHGVNLATGEFSGQGSFVEVPSDSSLQLGKSDFSVAAWISTSNGLNDVRGDIVSKFDSAKRKGFMLSLGGNTSGYNGQSDIRQLFFGTDDDTKGQWMNCGRPNAKTHISDAATVFNGDLYVGTTDAPDEADWAHVFRYKGGKDWEDCGRVGNGRTRGVYAMVAHDGALYAATAASHGMQPPGFDFGRVYRFSGGQEWEDIGQPGSNLRLHALASFNGKLYVNGFNIGVPGGHCYSYEGEKQWKDCGEFPGLPHTLAVHDGELYVAYPEGRVFSYSGNGREWKDLGNPFNTTKVCNQIHSMGVYAGELYAGCWPAGKVAVWRGGKWIDLGRLGDAIEIVGIAEYNGSLYVGDIPRAELFRFDGPQKWTSIRRLFDPPGYVPVQRGSKEKGVEDWTRASSLAVYKGKLFVTTATSGRTLIGTPLPDEIRGKVFSFATGASVSYDRDLGAGWKHVAAVREGKTLKLYIDGKLASSAEGDVLDISNDAPLRIGFGPQSHFCGKIRELRLYNRPLTEDDVRSLQKQQDVKALNSKN